MIPKLPFSHDSFFKAVMKDTKLAAELIRRFLPAELVETLDLSTLKLANVQFVRGDLKQFFSDIVFECELKDKSLGKVYINFLFEHKTKIPRALALQLSRYLNEGYHYQFINNKKLTPIIPVVIYHGKEEWEYIPMEKLFAYLPDNLRKFIPLFDFEYIDIRGKSEEELRSIGNSLLRSVLLTQKYIFDKDELLKKLSTILETFYDDEERNFLEEIIVYIMDNVEEIKVEEILLILPVKLKSKVMTLAQQLVSKGIKKGENKKTIEVILNGYNAGVPVNILAIQTNLPESEVKKIIQKYQK